MNDTEGGDAGSDTGSVSDLVTGHFDNLRENIKQLGDKQRDAVNIVIERALQPLVERIEAAEDPRDCLCMGMVYAIQVNAVILSLSPSGTKKMLFDRTAKLFEALASYTSIRREADLGGTDRPAGLTLPVSAVMEQLGNIQHNLHQINTTTAPAAVEIICGHLESVHLALRTLNETHAVIGAEGVTLAREFTEKVSALRGTLEATNEKLAEAGKEGSELLKQLCDRVGWLDGSVKWVSEKQAEAGQEGRELLKQLCDRVEWLDGTFKWMNQSQTDAGQEDRKILNQLSERLELLNANLKALNDTQSDAGEEGRELLSKIFLNS